MLTSFAIKKKFVMVCLLSISRKYLYVVICSERFRKEEEKSGDCVNDAYELRQNINAQEKVTNVVCMYGQKKRDVFLFSYSDSLSSFE